MSDSKNTKTSGVCLVLASMVAFTASDISGWMAPEVVGFLMGQGMGEAQAGTLLTAELMALFLTVLIASQFAGRLPTRLLFILGLVLAVTTHSLSAVSHDFAPLLVLRLLAGTGMGLLSAMAVLSLASSENAANHYPKLYMFDMAVGSALLFCMGGLKAMAASIGLDSAFTISAGLVLVLGTLALLAGIPKSAQSADPQLHSSRRIGLPNASSYLMSIGSYVLAIGCGITFAYSHVYGEIAGLDGDAVNRWLGIGIFAAIPGGLLCVFLAGRGNGLSTVLALLVIHTLANYLITQTPGQYTFAIGLMLNLGSIYFLLPFLQGLGIRFDPVGGCSAAIASSFPFSVAIAGLLGGYWLEVFGPASVVWLVLATNVLAALLFLLAISLFKPVKAPQGITQTA